MWLRLIPLFDLNVQPSLSDLEIDVSLIWELSPQVVWSKTLAKVVPF